MPGPSSPTPDSPTRNADRALSRDALASGDATTPDASVVGEAATPVKAAPSAPKISAFPPLLGEFLASGPGLSQRLAPIGKDKRFGALSFAVALLDDPTLTRIPYFGWNDDKQKFGASLVKVAAMTAAFALRDAVQRAAKDQAAEGAEELFKLIGSNWKEEVSKAFPEGKPDFPNLLGSNLAGSKLTGIFAAVAAGNEGQWTIDFTSKEIPAATDDPLGARDPNERRKEYSRIHDAPKNKKPKDLKFRERMEFMIDWSDNWFAGTCIDDLGFQYINKCMGSLGLFDPKQQRGLWLSSNYDGRSWGKKPQPPGNTPLGATARAVMKFLVALDTNKLISPEASQEMRQLTNKTDFDHPPFAGVESLVKKALHDADPPRNFKVPYSKVGYNRQNGSYVNCSDCALVSRELENGSTKRYGIVILDVPNYPLVAALVQAIDSALTSA
jgi:hypothetical protein